MAGRGVRLRNTCADPMQGRFWECQAVLSCDVCSECSDKVCGKHGIINAKNRSVSEKASATPSQVHQIFIPPALLALAMLLLGLPER